MHSEHAFTVRAGLEAGYSRAELRGDGWARPLHGVRMPLAAASAAADLVEAARAASADDQFFSHVTAARIHGMPLPPRLARDARIHVASPTGRARMRRPGIVGHRLKSQVVDVEGLRVEAIADAFVHLASMLSVEELVAIGDWAVSPHRAAPCTREDLAEAIRRYEGARGLNRARRAVALVRVGSESPQETAVRLLVELAGLPAPVLQHVVRDAHGDVVARLDLAWPRLRLALEYDGAHHFLSHEQGERDIARIRRLEQFGWTVIRITRRDLEDGGRALLAHIRAAYARCSAQA